MDPLDFIFILLILGVLTIVIAILRFHGLLPIDTFDAWLAAADNHIDISFLQLFSLKWNNINPKKMVNALIKLVRNGYIVKLEQLETHHLKGGKIDDVVKALTETSNKSLRSSLNLIDKDFCKLLMHAQPFIINISPVTATSRNNRTIVLSAEITLQESFEKMGNTLGEETIIKRVYSALIDEIASIDLPRYGENAIIKDLLQFIQSQNLDSDTVYDIASIAISIISK